MKRIEPGFSFYSITNKENSPLNQSDKLPLVDNCVDESHCKELDGLTVVASPDGLSANAPQLKPVFPKHGTQAARLLAAFLHDEVFTHKSACDDLGISRLASVVHVLKHQYGWDIISLSLQVFNRFYEESKIGLYRLNAKDIAEAGDDGHRFADFEFRQMALLCADAKMLQEAL